MKRGQLSILLLLLMFGTTAAFAQTTAFNYQGQLTDGANRANGNYQLQFKLFDAASDGNQVGATISDVVVTVVNGVFSTRLDFGAEVFTGADRFLEIAVRRNTGEAYTTLDPRQQLASSPYSIRTLSAAQADLALDAQKLGGLNATEYVNSSTVNSTFIRNSATLQTGNFNINGDGAVGGNLGIGTSTPTTRLQVRTGTGLYGFTHTDGTTTLGTYVGSSTSGAAGGWLGTMSNHQLHFFTNNGQPSMTIGTTGNVGIGTATPQAKLHVAGNSIQSADKGGMVKALLYVSGNGTLNRCYNGVTGAATGTCGFSVTRTGSGFYQIDFGFQVTERFISVTTSSSAIVNNLNTSAQVGYDFRLPSSTIIVRTFVPYQQQSFADSDFFITVY